VDGRIGNELRQEREAHGIELEEVEAATGVRARFLRAIEEEDWGALPGEFYARAFTRTYARYLGLDPAEFALEHRPDRVGEGAAGPRVEPELVPRTPSARKARPWLPIAGALGGLLLLAVVVVVIAALSGGGETRSSSSSGGKRDGGNGGAGAARHRQPQPSQPPGTSLRLTATAEVWICLLDGSGKPLIDGEILQPGSEAGPFRSRRYSMSFGNGSVELMVDGRPKQTPATSSPIGFAIDEKGAVSEIPEGERPECA
jgi:transcriptional regulator with XRE-family HTH domain